VRQLPADILSHLGGPVPRLHHIPIVRLAVRNFPAANATIEHDRARLMEEIGRLEPLDDRLEPLSHWLGHRVAFEAEAGAECDPALDPGLHLDERARCAIQGVVAGAKMPKVAHTAGKRDTRVIQD